MTTKDTSREQETTAIGTSKKGSDLMAKFAPQPGSWTCSVCFCDEELMFSSRAKLYRYDKEVSAWKERGIGTMKILYNSVQERSRILMRREVVHEICANHFITDDMKLTDKKGTANAWIWNTFADFSEEVSKPEQLAVKFKSQDDFLLFKEKFEQCQMIAKKGTSKERETSAIGTSQKRSDLNSKFAPKPGSWSCSVCLVTNMERTTVCVACGAAKLSDGTTCVLEAPKTGFHLLNQATTSSASNSAVFGGYQGNASSGRPFTFGMSDAGSVNSSPFNFGISDSGPRNSSPFTFRSNNSGPVNCSPFKFATSDAGTTKSSTYAFVKSDEGTVNSSPFTAGKTDTTGNVDSSPFTFGAPPSAPDDTSTSENAAVTASQVVGGFTELPPTLPLPATKPFVLAAFGVPAIVNKTNTARVAFGSSGLTGSSPLSVLMPQKAVAEENVCTVEKSVFGGSTPDQGAAALSFGSFGTGTSPSFDLDLSTHPTSRTQPDPLVCEKYGDGNQVTADHSQEAKVIQNQSQPLFSFGTSTDRQEMPEEKLFWHQSPGMFQFGPLDFSGSELLRRLAVAKEKQDSANQESQVGGYNFTPYVVYEPAEEASLQRVTKPISTVIVEECDDYDDEAVAEDSEDSTDDNLSYTSTEGEEYDVENKNSIESSSPIPPIQPSQTQPAISPSQGKSLTTPMNPVSIHSSPVENAGPANLPPHLTGRRFLTPKGGVKAATKHDEDCLLVYEVRASMANREKASRLFLPSNFYNYTKQEQCSGCLGCRRISKESTTLSKKEDDQSTAVSPSEQNIRKSEKSGRENASHVFGESSIVGQLTISSLKPKESDTFSLTQNKDGAKPFQGARAQLFAEISEEVQRQDEEKLYSSPFTAGKTDTTGNVGSSPFTFGAPPSAPDDTSTSENAAVTASQVVGGFTELPPTLPLPATKPFVLAAFGVPAIVNKTNTARVAFGSSGLTGSSPLSVLMPQKAVAEENVCTVEKSVFGGSTPDQGAAALSFGSFGTGTSPSFDLDLSTHPTSRTQPDPLVCEKYGDGNQVTADHSQEAKVIQNQLQPLFSFGTSTDRQEMPKEKFFWQQSTGTFQFGPLDACAPLGGVTSWTAWHPATQPSLKSETSQIQSTLQTSEMSSQPFTLSDFSGSELLRRLAVAKEKQDSANQESQVGGYNFTPYVVYEPAEEASLQRVTKPISTVIVEECDDYDDEAVAEDSEDSTDDNLSYTSTEGEEYDEENKNSIESSSPIPPIQPSQTQPAISPSQGKSLTTPMNPVSIHSSPVENAGPANLPPHLTGRRFLTPKGGVKAATKHDEDCLLVYEVRASMANREKASRLFLPSNFYNYTKQEQCSGCLGCRRISKESTTLSKKEDDQSTAVSPSEQNIRKSEKSGRENASHVFGESSIVGQLTISSLKPKEGDTFSLTQNKDGAKPFQGARAQLFAEISEEVQRQDEEKLYSSPFTAGKTDTTGNVGSSPFTFGAPPSAPDDTSTSENAAVTASQVVGGFTELPPTLPLPATKPFVLAAFGVPAIVNKTNTARVAFGSSGLTGSSPLSVLMPQKAVAEENVCTVEKSVFGGSTPDQGAAALSFGSFGTGTSPSFDLDLSTHPTSRTQPDPLVCEKYGDGNQVTADHSQEAKVIQNQLQPLFSFGTSTDRQEMPKEKFFWQQSTGTFQFGPLDACAPLGGVTSWTAWHPATQPSLKSETSQIQSTLQTSEMSSQPFTLSDFSGSELLRRLAVAKEKQDSANQESQVGGYNFTPYVVYEPAEEASLQRVTKPISTVIVEECDDYDDEAVAEDSEDSTDDNLSYTSTEGEEYDEENKNSIESSSPIPPIQPSQTQPAISPSQGKSLTTPMNPVSIHSSPVENAGPANLPPHLTGRRFLTPKGGVKAATKHDEDCLLVYEVRASMANREKASRLFLPSNFYNYTKQEQCSGCLGCRRISKESTTLSKKEDDQSTAVSPSEQNIRKSEKSGRENASHVFGESSIVGQLTISSLKPKEGDTFSLTQNKDGAKPFQGARAQLFAEISEEVQRQDEEKLYSSPFTAGKTDTTGNVGSSPFTFGAPPSAPDDTSTSENAAVTASQVVGGFTELPPTLPLPATKPFVLAAFGVPAIVNKTNTARVAFGSSGLTGSSPLSVLMPQKAVAEENVCTVEKSVFGGSTPDQGAAALSFGSFGTGTSPSFDLDLSTHPTSRTQPDPLVCEKYGDGNQVTADHSQEAKVIQNQSQPLFSFGTSTDRQEMPKEKFFWQQSTDTFQFGPLDACAPLGGVTSWTAWHPATQPSLKSETSQIQSTLQTSEMSSQPFTLSDFSGSELLRRLAVAKEKQDSANQESQVGGYNFTPYVVYEPAEEASLQRVTKPISTVIVEECDDYDDEAVAEDSEDSTDDNLSYTSTEGEEYDEENKNSIESSSPIPPIQPSQTQPAISPSQGKSLTTPMNPVSIHSSPVENAGPANLPPHLTGRRFLTPKGGVKAATKHDEDCLLVYEVRASMANREKASRLFLPSNFYNYTKQEQCSGCLGCRRISKESTTLSKKEDDQSTAVSPSEQNIRKSEKSGRENASHVFGESSIVGQLTISSLKPKEGDTFSLTQNKDGAKPFQGARAQLFAEISEEVQRQDEEKLYSSPFTAGKTDTTGNVGSSPFTFGAPPSAPDDTSTSENAAVTASQVVGGFTELPPTLPLPATKPFVLAAFGVPAIVNKTNTARVAFGSSGLTGSSPLSVLMPQKAVAEENVCTVEKSVFGGSTPDQGAAALSFGSFGTGTSPSFDLDLSTHPTSRTQPDPVVCEKYGDGNQVTADHSQEAKVIQNQSQPLFSFGTSTDRQEMPKEKFFWQQSTDTFQFGPLDACAPLGGVTSWTAWHPATQPSLKSETSQIQSTLQTSEMSSQPFTLSDFSGSELLRRLAVAKEKQDSANQESQVGGYNFTPYVVYEPAEEASLQRVTKPISTVIVEECDDYDDEAVAEDSEDSTDDNLSYTSTEGEEYDVENKNSIESSSPIPPIQPSQTQPAISPSQGKSLTTPMNPVSIHSSPVENAGPANLPPHLTGRRFLTPKGGVKAATKHDEDCLLVYEVRASMANREKASRLFLPSNFYNYTKQEQCSGCLGCRRISKESTTLSKKEDDQSTAVSPSEQNIRKSEKSGRENASHVFGESSIVGQLTISSLKPKEGDTFSLTQNKDGAKPFQGARAQLFAEISEEVQRQDEEKLYSSPFTAGKTDTTGNVGSSPFTFGAPPSAPDDTSTSENAAVTASQVVGGFTELPPTLPLPATKPFVLAAFGVPAIVNKTNTARVALSSSGLTGSSPLSVLMPQKAVAEENVCTVEKSVFGGSTPDQGAAALSFGSFGTGTSPSFDLDLSTHPTSRTQPDPLVCEKYGDGNQVTADHSQEAKVIQNQSQPLFSFGTSTDRQEMPKEKFFWQQSTGTFQFGPLDACAPLGGVTSWTAWHPATQPSLKSETSQIQSTLQTSEMSSQPFTLSDFSGSELLRRLAVAKEKQDSANQESQVGGYNFTPYVVYEPAEEASLQRVTKPISTVIVEECDDYDDEAVAEDSEDSTDDNLSYTSTEGEEYDEENKNSIESSSPIPPIQPSQTQPAISPSQGKSLTTPMNPVSIHSSPVENAGPANLPPHLTGRRFLTPKGGVKAATKHDEDCLLVYEVRASMANREKASRLFLPSNFYNYTKQEQCSGCLGCRRISKESTTLSKKEDDQSTAVSPSEQNIRKSEKSGRENASHVFGESSIVGQLTISSLKPKEGDTFSLTQNKDGAKPFQGARAQLFAEISEEVQRQDEEKLYSSPFTAGKTDTTGNVGSSPFTFGAPPSAPDDTSTSENAAVTASQVVGGFTELPPTLPLPATKPFVLAAFGVPAIVNKTNTARVAFGSSGLTGSSPLSVLMPQKAVAEENVCTVEKSVFGGSTPDQGAAALSFGSFGTGTSPSFDLDLSTHPTSRTQPDPLVCEKYGDGNQVTADHSQEAKVIQNQSQPLFSFGTSTDRQEMPKEKFFWQQSTDTFQFGPLDACAPLGGVTSWTAWHPATQPSLKSETSQIQSTLQTSEMSSQPFTLSDFSGSELLRRLAVAKEKQDSANQESQVGGYNFTPYVVYEPAEEASLQRVTKPISTVIVEECDDYDDEAVAEDSEDSTDDNLSYTSTEGEEYDVENKNSIESSSPIPPIQPSQTQPAISPSQGKSLTTPMNPVSIHSSPVENAGPANLPPHLTGRRFLTPKGGVKAATKHDEDCLLVYEVRASMANREKASRLFLPSNFYNYTKQEQCSGCLGCRRISKESTTLSKKEDDQSTAVSPSEQNIRKSEKSGRENASHVFGESSIVGQLTISSLKPKESDTFSLTQNKDGAKPFQGARAQLFAEISEEVQRQDEEKLYSSPFTAGKTDTTGNVGSSPFTFGAPPSAPDDTSTSENAAVTASQVVGGFTELPPTLPLPATKPFVLAAFGVPAIVNKTNTARVAFGSSGLTGSSPLSVLMPQKAVAEENVCTVEKSVFGGSTPDQGAAALSFGSFGTGTSPSFDLDLSTHPTSRTQPDPLVCEKYGDGNQVTADHSQEAKVIQNQSQPLFSFGTSTDRQEMPKEKFFWQQSTDTFQFGPLDACAPLGGVTSWTAWHPATQPSLKSETSQIQSTLQTSEMSSQPFTLSDFSGSELLRRLAVAKEKQDSANQESQVGGYNFTPYVVYEPAEEASLQRVTKPISTVIVEECDDYDDEAVAEDSEDSTDDNLSYTSTEGEEYDVENKNSIESSSPIPPIQPSQTQPAISPSQGKSLTTPMNPVSIHSSPVENAGPANLPPHLTGRRFLTPKGGVKAATKHDEDCLLVYEVRASMANREKASRLFLPSNFYNYTKQEQCSGCLGCRRISKESTTLSKKEDDQSTAVSPSEQNIRKSEKSGRENASHVFGESSIVGQLTISSLKPKESDTFSLTQNKDGAKPFQGARAQLFAEISEEVQRQDEEKLYSSPFTAGKTDTTGNVGSSPFTFGAPPSAPDDTSTSENAAVTASQVVGGFTELPPTLPLPATKPFVLAAFGVPAIVNKTNTARVAFGSSGLTGSSPLSVLMPQKAVAEENVCTVEKSVFGGSTPDQGAAALSFGSFGTGTSPSFDLDLSTHPTSRTQPDPLVCEKYGDGNQVTADHSQEAKVIQNQSQPLFSFGTSTDRQEMPKEKFFWQQSTGTFQFGPLDACAPLGGVTSWTAWHPATQPSLKSETSQIQSTLQTSEMSSQPFTLSDFSGSELLRRLAVAKEKQDSANQESQVGGYNFTPYVVYEPAEEASLQRVTKPISTVIVEECDDYDDEAVAEDSEDSTDDNLSYTSTEGEEYDVENKNSIESSSPIPPIQPSQTQPAISPSQGKSLTTPMNPVSIHSSPVENAGPANLPPHLTGRRFLTPKGGVKAATKHDEDCLLVYEVRASMANREKASRLFLPSNFYNYTKQEQCSGCLGCRRISKESTTLSKKEDDQSTAVSPSEQNIRKSEKSGRENASHVFGESSIVGQLTISSLKPKEGDTFSLTQNKDGAKPFQGARAQLFAEISEEVQRQDEEKLYSSPFTAGKTDTTGNVGSSPFTFGAPPSAPDDTSTSENAAVTASQVVGGFTELPPTLPLPATKPFVLAAFGVPAIVNKTNTARVAFGSSGLTGSSPLSVLMPQKAVAEENVCTVEKSVFGGSTPDQGAAALSFGSFGTGTSPSFDLDLSTHPTSRTQPDPLVCEKYGDGNQVTADHSQEAKVIQNQSQPLFSFGTSTDRQEMPKEKFFWQQSTDTFQFGPLDACAPLGGVTSWTAWHPATQPSLKSETSQIQSTLQTSEMSSQPFTLSDFSGSELLRRLAVAKEKQDSANQESQVGGYNFTPYVVYEPAEEASLQRVTKPISTVIVEECDDYDDEAVAEDSEDSTDDNLSYTSTEGEEYDEENKNSIESSSPIPPIQPSQTQPAISPSQGKSLTTPMNPVSIHSSPVENAGPANLPPHLTGRRFLTPKGGVKAATKHDEDCLLVYEVRASMANREKASRLFLPSNFYNYTKQEQCSGCLGCRRISKESTTLSKKEDDQSTAVSPSEQNIRKSEKSGRENASHVFGESSIVGQLTISSLKPKEGDTFSLTQNKDGAKPFQGARAQLFAEISEEVQRQDEEKLYFEPFIPLPDEIQFVTGEEGLEVLFSERAKLYRFDADSGQGRVLMRREQIKTLCANNNINPGMELKPNVGSDRSWVWCTPTDYAEGEARPEKLAIKLKSAEIAGKFRDVFEDLKETFSAGLRLEAEATDDQQGAGCALYKEFISTFAVSSDVWTCEMCYVGNNTKDSKCIACNFTNPVAGSLEPLSKTSEEDAKVTPTSTNASIEPNTFQDFNKASTSGGSVFQSPGVKELASSQLFTIGRGESREDQLDDKMFLSPSKTSSPSKQGVAPQTLSAPFFQENVVTSLPFGTDTLAKFRFSLQVSPECPSGKPKSPLSPASPLSPEGHFEPVIPLPEKVECRTGEEGQEVMFCERCKLLRYDSDASRWKERGLGDIKILFDPRSGRYRVLMRREHVFKLCANHMISVDMELKPFPNSDRAWLWTTLADFSDEVAAAETLGARFKTSQVATEFKDTFDKALQSLKSEAENIASSAKPEGKETDHGTGKKRDDDILLVFERRVTDDQKERAKRLELPSNFFAYEDSSSETDSRQSETVARLVLPCQDKQC